MEKWIESEDFGSAFATPAAYSTAWVAMIRNNGNQQLPAFPQSLQWLRDNQLSDGSWGSKYPHFVYDRLLSTLAVILCLKQYNMECDSKRLAEAICAAENLLHCLSQLPISEKMTPGFEIILPSLVDKCAAMGIKFNQVEKIDLYRKERAKKLNKLSQYENSDLSLNNFSKCWHFSLEALSDICDEQKISEIIDKSNQMIGNSYSATAFAIINYNNLGDSIVQIENIAVENDGGVPLTYKMEVFDLAWSLGYIIMAGFDVKNPILSKHISTLFELWEASNGLVGGGRGFPPDADDIANCIFVFCSAGIILKSSDYIKPLMNFYRNNYFLTFESERSPSISTNINCLLALNQFRHVDSVNEIIDTVQIWLKNRIIENVYMFEDKWHYSPFYSMSRAVFAFENIDKRFCETLIYIMLYKQNTDGGWGVNDISTAEESAYVVIAICHWYSTNKDKKMIFLECLENCKRFFDLNNDIHTLWIDKTLYCPVTIVKTVIVAAKYILENFQKN